MGKDSATLSTSAAKKEGDALQGFINIFPFVGIAIVIIGFTLFTGGTFLSARNLSKLFDQTFSLLLVTMAASFLLAQGCNDMSIGATIGMAGAVAAYGSQISVSLALFAAIATGLVIGLVNGIMHSVLGINSMIATLAMSFILRGLLLIICQSGTVGIATDMYALDNTLLKVAIFLIYAVIAYLFFERHSYGKRCRAIGASTSASVQAGINIRRTKMIGFILVGATSGLAGFFTVIRSGAAMYNTGNMVEFNTLIALILGGMPISGGADSRFRCSIVGATLLGMLQNGMVLMGMGTYPQLIAQGVIFLIVLAMTFTIRDKLRAHKEG